MLRVSHLKLIFYLIFIIKLLECVHLFDHVDALAYHLTLPRYLTEVGFNETFKSFFIGLQAGYFEFLYVLPVSLFGNTALAQILCQMMHFLAGLGLLSFLATKSLSNKTYAYLLGIAVLTINAAPSVFLYAKNDGVVASLSFLLFLILAGVFARDSKYRYIFIGLLFGLIPGVKLTGLFPVLVLGFFFLYKEKTLSKNFLLSITLAIFVFSPICLLKFYYTGSPFFPALLSLFPGKLPSGIVDTYSNFTKSKITLSSLSLGMRSLFFAKLILLTSPLILFLSFKRKFVPLSFFLSLAVFTAYILVNGGNISERFYFAAIFFLVHGFFAMLEKLDFKWRFFPLLIFLAVMIDSKLDLSFRRIKKSIIFSPLSEREFIEENIPLTKLWRKIEISSQEKYTYVYTDLLYMGFYSPRGMRLEQLRMNPDALFYRDHKDKFLDRYSYLILNSTLSDIRSNLTQGYEKIDQVHEYVVFQRIKTETKP